MKSYEQTICVFLLAFISTAASASSGCHVPEHFKIFDATLYSGKPKTFPHHIEPLPSLSSFWRPEPPGASVPTKAQIHLALSKDSVDTSKIFFVNVEHWPNRGNDSEASIGLSKYKSTAIRIKEVLPQSQFGYYSILPVRDYWRSITEPESKLYQAWQEDNDRAAELVEFVDVLFPSLYTFYDDRTGWVTYATAQLKEARRIGKGKPVYAFLWPEYHNSSFLNRGKYLPRDYWRLQLETVSKFADGLVVWGGWEFSPEKKSGSKQWDDQLVWWRELLEWRECD